MSKTPRAHTPYEASPPCPSAPTISFTAAKAKAAVNAFIVSDQAKVLQEPLQPRAADPGCANWLAEWWNEYHDPTVMFVSCNCVHIYDKPDEKRDVRNDKLSLSHRPIIEEIESAMVIVRLDDYSPATREFGDGRNRFYDKHRVSVFENTSQASSANTPPWKAP
ncbi:uncharacterized protein BXZ73DRAFT_101744 [Epithele typhae]|uniref:uncharacterized protein n=1 Tax=Epithele typhae TaxID=378194 RepID=UPI002008212A|nr:uncharacterized protein BXZ73DRAFT_101744 [Epithele typhae]KAH9931162.1 hypothetical protein BXZ73DRAFT_101744 [Epithele typhae]